MMKRCVQFTRRLPSSLGLTGCQPWPRAEMFLCSTSSAEHLFLSLQDHQELRTSEHPTQSLCQKSPLALYVSRAESWDPGLREWVGGVIGRERVLGCEAQGLRSGPGFATVSWGKSLHFSGPEILPFNTRGLDLMICKVPVGWKSLGPRISRKECLFIPKCVHFL